MRPPPVHFPVVHCSTPPQKFGRCGAVLIFVWSLQAAATSPTATKLGQTMMFLRSRVMCVPPSSVFCSCALVSPGDGSKVGATEARGSNTL